MDKLFVSKVTSMSSDDPYNKANVEILEYFGMPHDNAVKMDAVQSVSRQLGYVLGMPPTPWGDSLRALQRTNWDKQKAVELLIEMGKQLRKSQPS